jgi:hypothetical protein
MGRTTHGDGDPLRRKSTMEIPPTSPWSVRFGPAMSAIPRHASPFHPCRHRPQADGL